MSNVNLLNHNMGIQQILDSPVTNHIPDAKPLASTVVSEAGLTEHFKMGNVQNNLENALTPDVGDGEILRPDIFNHTLKSCITKFGNSPNQAVQNMINNVLKPMANDKELLDAYVGLMIGG